MVHVLINGIDTELYHPATAPGSLRARLGLAAGEPLVGIVARLVPLKSHALLLDAFERVARDVPDAHLAIIGDGPLRDDLAARIAAMTAGPRVHLLGALHDLDRAYPDLDVFVLPSTMEGTSISILEAMASGACVVATAVGGTPDLLDRGAAGVLVPSGDVEALAAALRAALTDRARRASLAAIARQRVVDHFSLAAMLDRYERLYRGAPTTEAHASTPEIVSCAG
jgi:glycosyltransferase involved in cell wall biosynthesis